MNKEYWEDGLPQGWYSDKKGNEYWGEITEKRYSKYFPYLQKMGEFKEHKGEKVLEIGIGIGTDLLQYAENGSICYGVDITDTAIKITKERFKREGLKAELKQCDAENLPYPDNFFDVVYSMGVIHHIKNMGKAIKEAERVLKPTGKIIFWIYGKSWKYYFFKPLYHGIIQAEFLTYSFNEIQHKHTEIKQNVPIVRFFNKKDIKNTFGRYNDLKYKSYRGYAETLGNKFKTLNMLFCFILNVLFPYNSYCVCFKKKLNSANIELEKKE